MQSRKTNLNIAMLIILLTALFTTNPPKNSSARINYNYESSVQNNTNDSLSKLLDKKMDKVKELAKEASSISVKPKIIYKTRTVKPKHIILYVRHLDGTLTEHNITSEGGFFIVKEADISKGLQIELRDDTSDSRGWFKRLINRK